MPSSTVTAHRGDECRFEEEAHVYWFGGEGASARLSNRMMSASTLVHQFCAPFDERGAAERAAAREGRAAADVLAAWAARRDEACLFGTRVHEVAEDCLLGRAPRNAPRNARERAYFRAAWGYASRLRAGEGGAEVAGVERTVFWPSARVAGTADLVVRRGGVLHVEDWKTNESLMRPAFCRMLAPFAHLPDDALTRYALATSLYRLVMQLRGFYPGAFGGGRLLWIRPEGDARGRTDAEWDAPGSVAVEEVDVPYLPAEAAAMALLVRETPLWREWEREAAAAVPF